MSNIRCIVAATDFSTFSERAVQRAAHIARQHDAELHLVHVVRPLDLYPSLTLAPEAISPIEIIQHDQVLQEAEHTRLDDLASGLARQFGIRVRAVTLLGRTHSKIAAHAQEARADLLVAGSRGENTLMDLFLGSTASRLLRLASCPVLIVRNPADEPYRQVLAAVDFSPVSASVVAHALDLASAAPVAALHVLGSEVEQRLRKAKFVDVDITDWLTRLRAQADKQLETLLSGIENGETVDHQILPGSPPAVICQKIVGGHADLVVLGRHGHGEIGRAHV